MDPTLIVTALVVVALGYVLTTVSRTIRADRPSTPPGGPTDWRAEALSWERIGIR